MTERAQTRGSGLDDVGAAIALADIARAVTLRHFRSDEMAVENKGAAFDPVTAADREAEAEMRAWLARNRPGDGVLGEEYAATEGNSGDIWVIDPIDGTRAFLSGAPTWGVLIALSGAAGPRLGVIDQPYIGERFVGAAGKAWMQGPQGRRALHCRPSRPLQEAILFSTFPEVGSDAERAAFEALAARVRLTRFGLDCYAYALLAAGHIDLVVEAGLHPYDIHAPIAVIEAAGGVVTDWHGASACKGGRVLAAANRDIHAAALEWLANA